MAGYMENVLETVTIKAYPVIEEIKDFMKGRGALNALINLPAYFSVGIPAHPVTKIFFASPASFNSSYQCVHEICL